MENVRIEDWLSQVCESPKTRDSYTFMWGNFTKFSKARGKDPSSLVDDYRAAKRLVEPQKEGFLEEWQDVIRAFNTWLKPKYAPLTVKNHLAVVKSFLRYWDIPLKIDLPKHSYIVYHNRDLKKEELKKILTFASPRDRVIWLVMAESGMRSDNAVNLKYAQIKEDFEASRVPMKIMLHSSVLKDHVGDRFTFIGEDGFRELKAYLQGKNLKDDDYVFASERQGQCKSEQFSAASLSVKFNRLVQKLGIDKSLGNREEVGRPKPKQIRLHGLRKYFRNNMKADSSYIQFWMGHTLGVDAHYITRDVEAHKHEYQAGYEFLRVFETSFVDLRDLTEQLRKKDQQINDLEKRLTQLEQREEERRRNLERAIGITPSWENMTEAQKQAALELLEVARGLSKEERDELKKLKRES
jgi:integrase